MHGNSPAFLTDMGLLMFLAVTASLLGYCQTDEKGKTWRRDSRIMRPLLIFPAYLSHSFPPLLPPSPPFAFPRAVSVARARKRREKYGSSLSRGASRSDDADGRRDKAREEGFPPRARERAAKINFYGRRAGTSSSREFTYGGSRDLMVAARVHTHAWRF